MKKSLIFLGGSVLGFALNTETGKNIRNWAFTKAQDFMNGLVGKINEVTSPSPEESTEEEGK